MDYEDLLNQINGESSGWRRQEPRIHESSYPAGVSSAVAGLHRSSPSEASLVLTRTDVNLPNIQVDFTTESIHPTP
jgi:hypothetical protein